MQCAGPWHWVRDVMSTAAAEHLFDRLRDAENAALRNTLGLAAHEKECAIRYGHINENVAGIRKDLRTAAWAGISAMITVLGFLVKLVFFPGA